MSDPVVFPSWVIGRRRAVDPPEVKAGDYQQITERHAVIAQRGGSFRIVGETSRELRVRVDPKLPNKATVKLAKRRRRVKRFVSRYDPSTIDPRAIELGIVPSTVEL